MSLTLQHGRPENMTERLKKEQKVYELLDLLHIEYDRVDHEPAMHMDVGLYGRISRCDSRLCEHPRINE